MPRSHVHSAEAAPDGETLSALLRRYDSTGEAVSCEPLTQGLLNRGYHLATTRGRFFLKHHLDGDRTAIARQHRVTQHLDALGVPVAPPVPDAHGRTVAVIGGRCYALHPWVDGRHRDGGELTAPQCWRLGGLLGAVHTCLEQVMRARTGDRQPSGPSPDPLSDPSPGPSTDPSAVPSEGPSPNPSADPEDTVTVIDELLALVRGHRPRTTFDALAEHRLVERRALLERHAHRRPEPNAVPATGWVHGDFHPLNLLYRDTEPAAIVDWDRLGVQPRAEEAVRAAAIFFVRPGGTLALTKVRSYARAYRCTAGAGAGEMAAAVHRVWWERLNDFWMLRWHYQRGDRRADPQFPAAAALVVWWTREYEAVRDAFCG